MHRNKAFWPVVGAVLGGGAGWTVGYIKSCSGVTWSLLASPWSGAAFGVVIGLLLAFLLTGLKSRGG